MTKLTLLLTLLIFAAEKCQSQDFTCPMDAASCSECVEADSRCGYCSDISYTGPRCASDYELTQRGCGQESIQRKANKVDLLTNRRHSKIRRLIRPQRVHAKLMEGSSAIIPFVVRVPPKPEKEMREKTTGKFYLRVRKRPDVEVILTSAAGANCTSGSEFWTDMICSDVMEGDKVSFELDVQVTSSKTCREFKKQRLWVYVRVNNMYSSVMRLEVEKACVCPCERKITDMTMGYDDECSNNGTLSCGVCHCNSGWKGDNCDCDVSMDSDEMCRSEGSPYICSGRGDCVCGMCQCRQLSQSLSWKYSGKYCECNDYSCGYHNNLLCGGNGVCNCGTCFCNEGYSGEICECASALDTCLSDNGLVCNDAGRCVCGRCECDETLPNQAETCEPMYDEECSQNGYVSQGECICKPGYHGYRCECDAEVIDDYMCMKPGSQLVCEGRGDCTCGKCQCYNEPHFQAYGKFCECDDNSCDHYDDVLCGGNGVCKCGECICEEGFTGEACECSPSTETCMAANGSLCNGMGTCECGVCICNTNYRGQTCEECPTCIEPCLEYVDCVQCMVFQSGPLSAEECNKMCPYAITLVDVVDKDNPAGYCEAKDKDDCTLSFVVATDGNTINVQKIKECDKGWFF